MNFGSGSFMNGSCNYIDVCNTLSPTVSPITPIVTTPPSPAPTTCEERKWYALSMGGELMCSNGYDIPAGSNGSEYYFDSLQGCCDAEFGATGCVYEDVCVTPTPTVSPVTGEPTPMPSPKPTGSPVTLSPTLCEDKVFFFDGNVCSNEFYIADAPSYDSAMVCCEQNLGSESYMNGSCNYVDICNTLPPSPAPTIASTFGSTPTVSKETTGPPTMYAGRQRSQFKTDLTTDCREITGGHPAVCVKVCTAITSIFDGDILIDETAETTQEVCD